MYPKGFVYPMEFAYPKLRTPVMSKALATDIVDKGIRVVFLCPGAVDTPSLRLVKCFFIECQTSFNFAICCVKFVEHLGHCVNQCHFAVPLLINKC